MKKHFKFKINDPKQLIIALTGAFSTWAATGFQKDMPHLTYVIIGFVTGGLASAEIGHNSQSIPQDTHIATPYAQNLVSASPQSDVENPVKSSTDIKKLIKINSAIIK
jgi:hypothetical protein